MIKVKMLSTKPGSPDGITHRLYEAEHEYEVPSNLARLFIEMGAAEKVGEKMIRSAPMDKGVKSEEDEGTNVDEEADIPDMQMDAEVIIRMDKKEKKEYKKLILRMPRLQLEQYVDSNELPIPYKANWRDETLSARVVEVLGL